MNLPFAAFASHAWGTFFHFNAQRGADWDNLWFVVCDRVGANGGSCSWEAGTINLASLVIFLVLVMVDRELRRRRLRETPAWTLGFPVIALFLLTDKVYSPQYGLWLLPWFALALPSLRLFVAFEVADVAVFVTRFTWFGRLAASPAIRAWGYSGLPIGCVRVAILIRSVILGVCIVAWILRDPPPLSIVEPMTWSLERSPVVRRCGPGRPERTPSRGRGGGTEPGRHRGTTARSLRTARLLPVGLPGAPAGVVGRRARGGGAPARRRGAARGPLPPASRAGRRPGWPAHAVTPGWHNVFTSWEREDALWFLRIATGGYDDGDGSAAFFPLFRWRSAPSRR